MRLPTALPTAFQPLPTGGVFQPPYTPCRLEQGRVRLEGRPRSNRAGRGWSKIWRAWGAGPRGCRTQN
jgi:hypothetical protein